MTPQQCQNLLKAENKKYGKTMRLVHQDPKAPAGQPIQAWRSKNFLAQITKEESGFTRLSVNRCAIDHNGNWEDGISWDELQQIKKEVGLAETWAVEVFPPEDMLVNVANIRHLWLVTDAPFAWKSGRDLDRTDNIQAQWSKLLGL